jgi:Tol biopolymer transport system component
VKRATWLAVVAVIVLLAIPAVRHLREEPAPPPPAVHLSFATPSGSELGTPGDGLDAAISPDEGEIVFVATTRGIAQLWRRRVDSGDVQPLTGTEGGRYPAWKQSGGVVSFFADGKLKQIALDDGAVRVLADAPAPAGAAWMPDGSLLFAPDGRSPIRRTLHGRTSEATSLEDGDRTHAFPAAAGRTGEFAYIATLESGRRVVRLVTADGTRDLADTTGHAQLAGPYLLRARDGVLIAQRVDADTRTTTGANVPLAARVGIAPGGHGMFAASDRLLLVADAAPPLRDLVWHDPVAGGSMRISEPGDHWQVRLSSDDARVAVTSVDPLLRTLDVLVLPATGAGETQPLTRALAADTDPVWSPDGRRVLFRSLQSGAPRLFTRRVGVPGAPDEPLPGSEPGDVATDWSDSGVLLQAETATTGSDIWELDLATQARRPIARDGFDETDGRYSPDRRWISYVSDESGQADVYARETSSGRRVRVSFAGGSRPRWSRDGRSIFFVRGSRIMRADRTGDDSGRFAPAEPVMDAPGLQDFDVAHRSERLALLLRAPASHAPSVAALVGWQSLLAPGRSLRP